MTHIVSFRKGRKGVILYQLLRPELLQSNPVPLSPGKPFFAFKFIVDKYLFNNLKDAFTVWSKADPQKDIHNKEICDATMRLLKVKL